MTPYDDHDTHADADASGDGDPIPPLRRPEDTEPVHSQADLHRLWRSLMGELGFGRTTLWLTVLDADGRPTPALVQIDELPPPEQGRFAELMHLCQHLVEDVAPGGSVAFLYSRPGCESAVTDVERRWAAGLTAAAREAGLAGWPVHVANDRRLVVVSPDDLAAAG